MDLELKKNLLNLDLTFESIRIIDSLNEKMLKEAIEYSLILLENKKDKGATRYFFKDTKNKNNNNYQNKNINTNQYVEQQEIKSFEEINIMNQKNNEETKNFYKCENIEIVNNDDDLEQKPKKESIKKVINNEEKEEMLNSKTTKFIDLSDF